MKLNENIALYGELVALVPYRRHHVLKYNSWMQEEELQILTASEPLSLKEEYEMQETWHKDEKKLTFIILDIKKMRTFLENVNSKENKKEISRVEADCMIGDVNLFKNGETWIENAEISIMVAEKNYRRKGYGTEAAKLFMFYAINELQVKTFVAKIGFNNQPSINMFINRLHFREVSKSDVFEEITLQYTVIPNWKNQFSNVVCNKNVYRSNSS